jgi:hypothetical protein
LDREKGMVVCLQHRGVLVVELIYAAGLDWICGRGLFRGDCDFDLAL